MIDFEYNIVRSRRKRTLGIVIGRDGSVEVRIPWHASETDARRFLEEKQDWVRKNRARVLERRELSKARNWDQVRAEIYPWICSGGGRMFMDKVASWAERMGVEYNRIAIRDVRSRWASCSSKRNLSFSWKVFVMPERLVDYLIVHELAHLKHMNHSPAFWAVVKEYIPDYKARIGEFENYL